MRRIKPETKEFIIDTAFGIAFGSILAGGTILPVTFSNEEVRSETWVVIGFLSIYFFLWGIVGRLWMCFVAALLGIFHGWVFTAGWIENPWAPYCGAFAGMVAYFVAAALLVSLRDYCTWRIRYHGMHDLQAQVQQRDPDNL